MKSDNAFLFGLESEYLLLDSETFNPLWHEDLDFQELDQIFQSVYIADISSSGLSYQAPHSQNSPFLVEGYHCYSWSGQPHSILPKGIEIRTPTSTSLDTTLKTFSKLYHRLSQHLFHHDFRLCSLSFHPTEYQFRGPKGQRDSAFWSWAKTAMCTYGPDLNIQIPEDCLTPQFWDSLAGKINFYAPALSASSFSSPFYRGEIWETPTGVGQSVRSYYRAPVAPFFEFHGCKQGRFECNIFEMPNSLTEFRCFFLLWLTLLLDTNLPGRTSDTEAKEDLIYLSQQGLSDDGFRLRGLEVIETAFDILPKWGFDPGPLSDYSHRFIQPWNPSTHLQNVFWETGSLKAVLFERSHLDGDYLELQTQLPSLETTRRVVSL